MNKEKMSIKKIAAIGIGAALLAGAVGAGIAYNMADDSAEVASQKAEIVSLMNEKQLEVAGLKATIAALENKAPVIVEKNNTVVKEVPVETIVKVDNGNLELVLNEIYDNNGNVSYLTEDLDEDELGLIVDRIVFVNDVKAMAVAEVKSELVDEVNKMNVSGVILDDDDIARIKVNDDSNEISVDVSDFEDKDADAIVTGTFENDEVKYNYTAEVSIRDGKVEDIDFDVVKA